MTRPALDVLELRLGPLTRAVCRLWVQTLNRTILPRGGERTDAYARRPSSLGAARLDAPGIAPHSLVVKDEALEAALAQASDEFGLQTYYRDCVRPLLTMR